jgi:Bifunctional DNA primase/polymerase, N-terminal/Primase C terminal 2 (PriCT-2)
MNDGAAPFPEDALTAALRYAERDWLVFPVPPGTKKSHTSAERGNGRRWGATRDPMEIEYYFKKWPKAGVGLPTGADNGFFVLEVDTFEAHGKDGLASLRALEAEHGRLPDTLMAMSPTGSIHRYFAYPKTPGVDIRNSASKLGPGIDVKGSGGMVVGVPTQTEKGRYQWLNDLPIAEAPDWLINLIDEGARPRRAANPQRNAKYKPIDGDALRDVMEGVPNDLRTSWEAWNTVGMALFAATNGSSFGAYLFDEYSQKREDKYDPEKTEAKWEAYHTSPPNNISVRKLFYLASCAQFEAEVEAIAVLEARGEWDQTPIETAFPDDLPDDDLDPDDEESDDDALLARRAPTIDPRAFYGILDTIVTETTRESEATKVGVAAQTMAHVSLTMRPFYNPLGNDKISFNLYLVQLGPSGKGRKGTSAAIADNFLGPALLRQALLQSTRIAFSDEDEDTRNAAKAEVEETARKLSWTRNVSGSQEAEIEAELATLRDDHAAVVQEIGERKARLKAKACAPRTVRDYEKLILEREQKRANLVELIVAAETELTAVKAVLKDQAAALKQAQANYDAAQAKLDKLPPPTPPAPWRVLFASLAEGPVTTTGVSTGEGLIELIRDPGQRQGLRGPVHDPGVANKCLFLNLDELGSVLAVIMRPGATLSSVLRTMWDCRKTELVNKNSPTRVKEPYATMSASITPGELMGRLFDKRDAASSADNGLGNRLLYLWVKRDKLKARPLATPGLDAMMDTVAGNILHVYETLKPEGAFLSTPIDFSPEAYARYELEYPRIANLKAAGRNAAKLIERLPVYLRKIAAILAVMNGEHQIGVGALEAAIAWIEYGAGTVNAIAATAAERKNTKILAEDGETILAELKTLGGDTKPVSMREVRRKTRLDKKRFDAAIVELLQQGPSPIVVFEEKFVSGHATQRTRAMLILNQHAEREAEI